MSIAKDALKKHFDKILDSIKKPAPATHGTEMCCQTEVTWLGDWPETYDPSTRKTPRRKSVSKKPRELGESKRDESDDESPRVEVTVPSTVTTEGRVKANHPEISEMLLSPKSPKKQRKGSDAGFVSPMAGPVGGDPVKAIGGNKTGYIQFQNVNRKEVGKVREVILNHFPEDHRGDALKQCAYDEENETVIFPLSESLIKKYLNNLNEKENNFKILKGIERRNAVEKYFSDDKLIEESKKRRKNHIQ
jgi:hypothetical protein